MIIYGKRASHLKSTTLTDVTCPNCKTQGSVVLGVFAQYVHIFWIPTISIGRTAISQCANCKQSFEGSKMPFEFQRGYHTLLKETKIPVFHFAGAALIGIAIAYGVFSSGQAAAQEAEYFASPQKGDHYTVRMEDGYYTTFKVDSVSNDSLYVYWNTMAVDKVAGIGKIGKAENYSAEREPVQRNYLKELRTQNKIHKILRSTE